MPVTLGANNTIRVNGKVIEFGKFDGTTPSQNVVTTSTLSAPTMTSAAAIPPVQTADTGIKYVSFTTTNTPYNVTFPTSVSCDILIVGGGGGASGSYNGSGAGGVLYMVNKIFQGGTAYKVLVGGGATGGNGGNSSITLGNDTAISFDGITLIGKGGGRAFGGQGGSSGGYYSDNPATQGNTFWDGSSYVAGGHNGGASNSDGGGGAGGPGNANGGPGRAVSITGSSVTYGQGGAGYYGNGKGGGSEDVNAAPNTGGGGASYSGAGGSGIVILRFSEYTNTETITYNTPINFRAEWTYNASNANVYHLGNVGIGITNPTNALHVEGDTFSSTYSGGSKTFKIEHPLKLNRWLYHGCIEGPRFDNIYRGKKVIIAGKAEVDIDKECNTTGGMTPGTFPALNTNYQLYLQNNKTFDRVKGSIDGSKIQIESQNVIDEIEVDWMVVGERHDVTVINPEFTDNDGNLICEHEMAY
jgi:hypothetical protein